MTTAARIKVLTMGLALSLSLGTAAHAHSHPARSHVRVAGHPRSAWQHYGRYARFATRSGHSSGHLQCVPFARMNSGIELTGNANAWWAKAAGVYQRGNRPEPGSVLSFQSNGVMRLGHVAVVTQVIDGRTVAIDQANWGGPGQVSRDITAVDVSPRNDWSAVRVGLGHSGDFGSIYPTNGFIYNRPDTGTLIASASDGTPIPVLNPAPRDLRGSAHESEAYDEVAEAPDAAESHWHRHVSYRHVHHASHHHRHAT